MINQSYMVAIFVTVHSLAEAARRRFVAIINPSRQCEDSCLIFPSTRRYHPMQIIELSRTNIDQLRLNRSNTNICQQPCTNRMPTLFEPRTDVLPILSQSYANSVPTSCQMRPRSPCIFFAGYRIIICSYC